MFTVLSKCSELREFSQIHLSEAKQDVLIMLCNEPKPCFSSWLFSLGP